MKLPRRQVLHLVAGAAALPVISRIASAETYPTRPVRFSVTNCWPRCSDSHEQDIAENEKRSRSLFENFMQEHGVPRKGDTAFAPRKS
jgi:hypothetical protein